MKPELRDTIVAALWWVAALFIFLALLSFHPQDIHWESAPVTRPPQNVGGLVGAYCAYALLRSVGWSAYLCAGLFALWGWMRWIGIAFRGPSLRIVGTAAFLIGGSALWALGAGPAAPVVRGGLVGAMTAELLYKYLGSIGALLVGWAVTLLAISAVTDFLIWMWLRTGVMTLWGWLKMRWMEYRARRARQATMAAQPAHLAKPARVIKEPSLRRASTAPTKLAVPVDEDEPSAPKVAPAIRVIAPDTEQPPKRAVERPLVTGSYILPPTSLLQAPPPVSGKSVQDNLQANSQLLEDTLRDFGVEADVVEVEKGPAITRYELQAAPGTKVNRIAALSEELALALRAQSVRVASIAGKSRIGVEVPNTSTNDVYLRELIESNAFQNNESPLMMALGKDVSGNDLVFDLRKCPHILIAGATGSGKTVCLNAIITGMLFLATPDELRFLLIDPKRVELVSFNKIPHLVAPVVTDVKKAAAALGWAVTEMENRYKRFAEVGVRNLQGYNEKVSQAHAPIDEEDDEPYERLPYIVIVIDELADLMAVAQNDVESLIMRLAQMSRAVGIHIIMATQRPSVDVVTGVIKANFPARLAFQVATKIDSRTVLDMAGADKLLGRGDMLFLNPGSPKPFRAQGCLVSDAEIDTVVAHVRQQCQPRYNTDFMTLQDKPVTGMRGTDDRDELFDEAKQVIMITGQASTSMLQRRMRLGYTRAARILDQLEVEGIVGPPRGAKPREILIELDTPVGVDSGETE